MINERIKELLKDKLQYTEVDGDLEYNHDFAIPYFLRKAIFWLG